MIEAELRLSDLDYPEIIVLLCILPSLFIVLLIMVHHIYPFNHFYYLIKRKSFCTQKKKEKNHLFERKVAATLPPRHK
jgi:hypothetical protein